MRWLAVGVLALACNVHREPAQWHGMDRSAVSCVDDGWYAANCIGAGRMYRCIREAGSTVWQCAVSRAMLPAAEASQ